jgi:hypothetical protein
MKFDGKTLPNITFATNTEEKNKSFLISEKRKIKLSRENKKTNKR